MQNKNLTIFCALLTLLLAAGPAMAVEIILPESVNNSITYADELFNNDPIEHGASVYMGWIALGTVGGSGIVGLVVLVWSSLRRTRRPSRSYYRSNYQHRGQRRSVIRLNGHQQRRIITRRVVRSRSILGWVW